MSSLTTGEEGALLQQALDSQRAGRRDEAERAYCALLDVNSGHAQANHNLGVLLVQTGRPDAALAHLHAALRANSRAPVYWFSYVKGLLAANALEGARATLEQARRCGLVDARFDQLQYEVAHRQSLAQPANPVLLDELGSALLPLGRIAEAIECYREALRVAPDFADAHYHLGSVLSENDRVAEGFAHYMRRAALVYGAGDAPSASEPEPPHKIKHDRAQQDYLTGKRSCSAPPVEANRFELADGERLGGSALNAAHCTPALLAQWRRRSPQMVVIDDFLTLPALLKLRAYCAGSTVWRKIYAAGYLGAAPEDGFACPLLAQIVEEIQSAYRIILGAEKFRYLGAFKYDSDSCAGTNTHADNAIVNVNFYITPDEANLDPEHGGMKIWDRAAPSIDALRRYNSDERALQAMLRETGAQATIVPHRSNRAVIFKSTLFHQTDTFRFRSDYLSRRINVSLLFGQFG